MAAPATAAPDCASCHAEVAQQYRANGMARTFARAVPAGEVEASVRHAASGQVFQAFVKDGQVTQQRWPDDAPSRTLERPASYTIGSGNHARSYLFAEPDGTLTQLPLSWYTQGKYWAMSPGYDRAKHAGFSRQIEPGCLFCHNSYPKKAPKFGAVTRYEPDLAQGIGCERCHGEGDRHAAAPAAGNIVNPAKLPADRALDVCMQCHLETTSAKLPHALRRYGREVYSFRPGERLSSYLVQFDHAAGSGHEDKFEINSAGYRMLQSACFLKSGRLTCTSCHDPHLPAAGVDYRKACLTCHQQPHDSGDCVGCHMPKRRAEDAVHVVMTDHKIQKPPANLARLLAPRQEHHEAYRGPLEFYRTPGLTAVEKNLYLGQALISSGSDRRRGIELLAKTLPAKPVLEAMVELASAYVSSGQPKLAIPWFQRVLAINPAMPRVRYNYALAMNSAALMKQVVAAEPAFAEALNSYGTMLQPAPAARQYFLRAHEARPAMPEPLHNLGLLDQSSGDLSGARGWFERALAADPGFAPAYNSLGRLEAQEGRLDRAIPHFQKAVALDDEYAEAQYNLGRLLQQANEHQQALPHLERAAALRPRLAEAHMALGVAYGELERFADAARAFERVLRLQPGNQEAEQNLRVARDLAKP